MSIWYTNYSRYAFGDVSDFVTASQSSPREAGTIGQVLARLGGWSLEAVLNQAKLEYEPRVVEGGVSLIFAGKGTLTSYN